MECNICYNFLFEGFAICYFMQTILQDLWIDFKVKSTHHLYEDPFYKNSHLLKEYLVVLMPKRGQFFPQFKLQLITSTCGQLICSFHHFWQSQLLFHSNIPNLFFFVKIQTSFGRILKRSHPNWQQSVSQINLCSRSENKHLFRK